MDITPPLESANQKGFNTISEGCTTPPREATRVVKSMTQKTNQIKYYKVSISCLYLIN